jgi:hypothetical protein
MTRAMQREISGDEIAFVLLACLANSERFATTNNAIVTTSDAMATSSNSMATVLTVLGLQFVARGLASNVLELLRSATRVRRDAINQIISGVCSVRSPCA